MRPDKNNPGYFSFLFVFILAWEVKCDSNSEYSVTFLENIVNQDEFCQLE